MQSPRPRKQYTQRREVGTGPASPGAGDSLRARENRRNVSEAAGTCERQQGHARGSRNTQAAKALARIPEFILGAMETTGGFEL